MAIKNKAILVSLSVSIWTNAVKDASVVDGIMKKTDTPEDVHRYKKVLIKPEALTQVRAARIALRSYWWENTLPWGNSGIRLLPSTKYQEFVEKMRELRIDYDRAVTTFCREYPKMKAEARQRLHSLFDERDFPSLDGIKRKFGCSLDFAPIPDGDDFRVKLSEDEVEALRREVERSVEENTQGAMKALVEKLQETVSHLTERMKEAEPVVRTSLIENIKEACTKVEAFNLIDDKKIDALRKATEGLVKGVEVDRLREDKKTRKELATRADEVLAKMAAYIGASGG